MKDIILKTPAVESVIHCGKGAFDMYAPALKDKQLFIVTDANVFAYYRHEMWRAFGDNVSIFVIPAGESAKNIRNLTAILKAMLKAGLKRGGTVIAFGGGVIGDIAGLAASLYMRGVHLVQIPTTLLSQVDSSVGGKTAVDFEGVKNVIGTFYQPEEVIADPKFFDTLPAREIRCGLGEIVKYGALNADILSMLFDNFDELFSEGFFDKIVYPCICHKKEVVMGDERDLNGLRKTLNLGHTTGHAFELYYRRKSHGEFVLIGMYYELYIARKYGICADEYAKRIEKLILKIMGKIPAFPDVEKAAQFALFDKKNDDNNVSLVVPQSDGKCKEIKLPVEEYAALLKEARDKI